MPCWDHTREQPAEQAGCLRVAQQGMQVDLVDLPCLSPSPLRSVPPRWTFPGFDIYVHGGIRYSAVGVHQVWKSSRFRLNFHT